MVRGERLVLAAIALTISAGLGSRATAAERLGRADWRGEAFDGRTTANGDRFDMYQLTAASADLPLNSYATVTNTATGESVVVRINDRPSAKSGLAITLSFAAAHRLGVDVAAAPQVKISAVGSPPAIGKLQAAPREVAAGDAGAGSLSGLRLARMNDELTGARSLFRGRGRRKPLQVTWAEDAPVPLAGL
jgi:rare lipoprotein A (peptidoglycan hydrolase)